MKPWHLLPDNPAEELLTAEEWVAIGATFGLTGRELDVAILLFEDKTRASMARKLSRRPAGIRKRIDRVFQKMNVRDKLGLVHRVWRVYRALYFSTGHKDAPCKTDKDD